MPVRTTLSSKKLALPKGDNHKVIKSQKKNAETIPVNTGHFRSFTYVNDSSAQMNQK